MSPIQEFIDVNGIKQKELAAFLGIGEPSVSKMAKGFSKPSKENLYKLLNNNRGWDVSMLRETPSISANASHNSKASVSIRPSREDGAAEITFLKRELELLREQLTEEKKRSAQYWDMIQRLTK